MTLRRLVLPAIVATAAVLPAVCGSGLALAQVNQHLILASDNSSYIVLAQALAQGRGYVMVNEPLAPAMNLYPPGYPLLLAPLLSLAGAVSDPLRAVALLKLVAVAFYLATLPVFYFFVQRRRGALLATLATLLVAVNPALLTLATEILSETPFIFLTLAGLLLLERSGDMPAAGRRFWGLLLAAALCLAAAYYMRTAAIAILAAAPLSMLLNAVTVHRANVVARSVPQRRSNLPGASGGGDCFAKNARRDGAPYGSDGKRRPAAALLMGALLAALALPWFLRSSAPPTPETPFFARSYIHQVLALAPYSDQNATVLDLLGRVASNSWTYAVAILPETMLPHLERLGPLAPAVSLGMALLIVLGFVLEARRGLRAGELAVAAYFLSLSLFVWVLGFRYITVLLPFAFLYLLVAVQWLAQRVVGGLRRNGRMNATPGTASVLEARPRALPRACPAAERGAGPAGERGAGWARGAALVVVIVAAVLVVSGLAVNLRRAERNLRRTRQQTLAQVYAADREWTGYLQAAEWLAANAAPDAVLMSRKPDLLYLLVRRPTVEYPYTQDTAALQRVLVANYVSYILEDAFTWTRTTETYLAPAMRGAPAAFTLVHETATGARVWRVR